jgi:hypothetical protein
MLLPSTRIVIHESITPSAESLSQPWNTEMVA